MGNIAGELFLSVFNHFVESDLKRLMRINPYQKKEQTKIYTEAYQYLTRGHHKFNHISNTINHISKSLAKRFYKVVAQFWNWLNVSFLIFLEAVSSCFFFSLHEVHFRYNLDFLQEF